MTEMTLAKKLTDLSNEAREKHEELRKAKILKDRKRDQAYLTEYFDTILYEKLVQAATTGHKSYVVTGFRKMTYRDLISEFFNQKGLRCTYDSEFNWWTISWD